MFSLLILAFKLIISFYFFFCLFCILSLLFLDCLSFYYECMFDFIKNFFCTCGVIIWMFYLLLWFHWFLDFKITCPRNNHLELSFLYNVEFNLLSFVKDNFLLCSCGILVCGFLFSHQNTTNQAQPCLAAEVRCIQDSLTIDYNFLILEHLWFGVRIMEAFFPLVISGIICV